MELKKQTISQKQMEFQEKVEQTQKKLQIKTGKDLTLIYNRSKDLLVLC